MSTASAQTSAGAATAQGPEVVGEIIVTATRRESGAQSVPLALTAIGAEQLRNTGVTRADDLTRLAPSLVVNSDVSVGSPRFSLRGLSSGDVTAASSPAISTYIDDVAQAAQNGIGDSFFDLQRIEVLRGPQGTTFGKNTTGGAVAYFTQTPTNRVEGYLSGRVGFGDRNEQALEGAVNLPVVEDQLAARVSFRIENQNDWQRNLGPRGGKFGGGETYSGRAQLRWTPDTESWANLTFYTSHRRGDPVPTHAEYDATIGGPTYLPLPAKASRTTVTLSDYGYYNNYDNNAVTLRIGHHFGLFDLTSITHYRHTKSKISQDLDATALDLFHYPSNSKSEQYGQEIRIASDAARPLSGLLGLYLASDKIREQTTEASTQYGPAGIGGPFAYFFDPDDTGPIQVGDQIPVYDFNHPAFYRTKTDTYAIFGNLSYKLTRSLSITGGIRKTIEKKKLDGQAFYYVFPGQDWTQDTLLIDPASPPGTPDYALPSFVNKVKSKPVTWDVTVDFTPSRDLLFFGRVAKGFRSGGFNQAAAFFPWSPFFDPRPLIPGSGVPPLGKPPVFQGESVRSYELGFKSSWGRYLRVNATIYHYDYKDQQVTTFPQGILSTINAATSKVDGGEIEMSAQPTRELNLNASLGYTNARYDSFFDPTNPSGPQDFSGNRLNQAPRWSANWALNYRLPVSSTNQLRFNTSWTYRSEIFYNQENSRGLRDPSLIMGNVRISFEPSEGKGLTVAAYVNNLTNKRPLTFGIDNAAPGFTNKYFGVGRTFGVDAGYRW